MVWKMCFEDGVHATEHEGHLCAFRCKAKNATEDLFGEPHWKCLRQGQKEPDGGQGVKGKQGSLAAE